MSEARAELPEGWEWVKLGDVCKQDRQIIEGDSETALVRPFLGMEHVESQTGKILIDLSSIEGTESKSTTFAFNAQHVLYGKLRPYLNKVVMPDFEGRCSTELIPLLPKGVSRAFLTWLLRSPQIIEAAMLTTTGSRMPRANLNDLMKVPVPIPPLESQIQITETLEKQMAEVDRACAATEAQLEAADVLSVSILQDVFESDIIQSGDWVKLGDVCETTSGGTPARGVAAYYGGSIPWVKSGELEDGSIATTQETITQAGLDGSSAKLFPSGTLLIALYGATVGKLGILEMEAASNQAVCGISVGKRILRDYLFYFLLYFRDELIKISFGGAQPNISQKVVRAVELPLPSVSEQQRLVDVFHEKLAGVEKLKRSLVAQLETINALPASLLRQAFSGELTRQPSPEDLRAALTCLAVERLHHRVFFGVVQLMKVLYFAQAHHGIPLGYTMRRHTYGPFDKAVYDLEKEGERQGWFSVDKAVDKQGSKYVPGAELDSLAREAEGTLGRWKDELNGLLDLAETFDTTGLEALATLYAAWNDLLLEGRQPTDGEIIAEVLEGWPGKAEKFSKGELRQYLAYLKATPYIPKGTGQSTRLTYAA